MIKHALFTLVFAISVTVPANADDMLPVFGGEAQTPFSPELPLLPPPGPGR